jgi:EAL domain-containing protein (putative c-di-GMP-specific phosphodiesterase class I)
LHTAIKQDQLRLFYHPIVHLAGSSVVGHEVLIRWQHPEHGLLGPSDFLPYIESDAGLSRDLGLWVLRQACGSAAQQNDELYVSVNVSPLHLTQAGFADSVVQTLHMTGFSPARLILEITERAAATSDESTVAACYELTELGVTIALDDFGTGSVDPQFLDRLPIGMLKIDRSVTAGIETHDEAAALVIRALQLGKSSNRQTVAEGVENHAQANFLREHGATYAQGYLFGRPRPR